MICVRQKKHETPVDEKGSFDPAKARKHFRRGNGLGQVGPDPIPGVTSGLVIAGSDKRGTIYGIYDLSEQIGVSPWCWWADAATPHKDALFVKNGRYDGRRKPELLDPSTYSLTDYREADPVVADFNSIAARAEQIHGQLAPEARDAFYQLVLFPVKACAQVNELYAAVGKNRLFARQGRAAANDLADHAEALFQADARLMNYFNRTFAGGKWNHFMDQVHIGCTIWQDPPQNVMPEVRRIPIAEESAMAVAVEGSASAWPGEAGHPETDSRIHAAFEQLFHGNRDAQTVYYPAGKNENGALACLSDINSNDVRTEGMSCGMMIAVQRNRKAEFDALWNWALQVPAGRYRYYDGMLFLMALLYCSGEYRIRSPGFR